MYRKYINDLEKWFNSERRKPLIVWGARQVGKTTLIKNLFAKKYFPNKTIYIDCRVENDFVNYCQSHINPKDVIEYISLSKNMAINEKTLLIFDEVQECLPIITLLKYFCQDYSSIPIIVTGSMVRIKLQRENKKRGASNNGKFLFPSGKINQLTIYPMNFEEYLINRNKVFYDALKTNFTNKIPNDELIHKKALDYLYEYLLVGGMPEAVDVFLKTESYFESRNTLIDLYDNYLADMDLYQASHNSIVRAKKIFENIFSQLNKESKNFKATLIENNIRNRDLINPLEWLSLAHLVEKSSLIKEKVSVPLIDSSETLFRLYLSDMGLFSYQSKINPVTFIDKKTRNSLSGIFFENYVANELINGGYKLFYWKGKDNAEFEFIIEYDSNIIPIDVKKSKENLHSLEKYKNHNNLFVAIKISESRLGYEPINKILNIPFYYVPFAITALKEGNINLLINKK